MILLDTDHLSTYRYAENPRAQTLRSRLDAAEDRLVATTAITLEEQMRGWLAKLAQRKTADEQVSVYDELIHLVRFFHSWEVIPFNGAAAMQFTQLRKQRIRIGTQDLKIAAITLANDALLLSANLRDFRAVPHLRVENWLE